MAKKPNRLVPDAKDVYLHALQFLATDELLRSYIGRDEKITNYVKFPSMIMTALTSELLLKCLLILEKKIPPDKHNLETLFNLHDPLHKAQIQALWDNNQVLRKAVLDMHEKILQAPIPRDLPKALADCGDAFILFRYVYEDPLKPAFYISFFPHFVLSAIRDITGWE